MSPEQVKKTGKGGWLFLFIVIGIYATTALFSPDTVSQASTDFIRTLGRVLPVLGLVFVLIFISNLILKRGRLEQYLGKGSGLKGWVLAVLAGILSMGPIYPWFALLAELKQQGMRNALIAAFLYSRAIKLPLLPLLVHYFGLAFTVVLCLYLAAFSVISGLLLEKLEDRTTPFSRT